jgi:hypothetical protein
MSIVAGPDTFCETCGNRLQKIQQYNIYSSIIQENNMPKLLFYYFCGMCNSFVEKWWDRRRLSRGEI